MVGPEPHRRDTVAEGRFVTAAPPYLLLPAACPLSVVAVPPGSRRRRVPPPGTSAGARHRPFRSTRGAVAYGFTGYLVGWASWPQSNVAAFAPALLWSVESLVSEPRPRRAVPVAGAIAALYLSNFPLAATYVVIAVALYAVARLIALHGARPLHHVARSALRPDDLGVAGVALGMAAISIYLSEFTTYLDVNDTSYPGRQTGRLQHRDPLSVDPRAPVGIRLSPPDAGVLGRRFRLDRSPGLCGRIGPAPWPSLLLRTGVVPAETLQQRFASCGESPSSACGFPVGDPLTGSPRSLPLLGGNSIGRSRVVTHLAVAALAGLGTGTHRPGGRPCRSPASDPQRSDRLSDRRTRVLAVKLVDWGRGTRSVLQTTIEQAWLPVLAGIAMIVAIAVAVRR